jgi:hypothetical protein
MAVFSEQGPDEFTPEEPPSSRLPLIVAAVVVLIGLVGVAWWLMRPAKPAAPTEPRSEVATDAPVPAPKAIEPAPAPKAAEPATPRRPRAPREKPVETEPEPAPVPVAARTLVVDSDVPGASVFLNRKYLGTTPLKTTDVTAGTGQLNVSAEGHDGVARTVDIADSGVTEVMIRLKEVRLDASVPVVHKHGMGSCEGTLRASVNGLRYDTANKGDAFTVSFASVESFTIDYLQKGLRLKQRGGKTWNFTTKDTNADALFVFHRDVEKARIKLASQ